MLLAIREAEARVARLEQAIRDALPEWSLSDLVTALTAVRGFDLVSASALLAEWGDLSRFATARELMGYLGLVPSEQSTGEKVRRGGITRAGNRRARRILIECSWSYRHPPRLGKEKLAKVAATDVSGFASTVARSSFPYPPVENRLETIAHVQFT
jgi:transposase